MDETLLEINLGKVQLIWRGELYENKYPLVAKGMWSGIINLKTNKLLNWRLEYGNLCLQAKICDSGTYFLLDKDKKAMPRLPITYQTV